MTDSSFTGLDLSGATSDLSRMAWLAADAMALRDRGALDKAGIALRSVPNVIAAEFEDGEADGGAYPEVLAQRLARAAAVGIHLRSQQAYGAEPRLRVALGNLHDAQDEFMAVAFELDPLRDRAEELLDEIGDEEDSERRGELAEEYADLVTEIESLEGELAEAEENLATAEINFEMGEDAFSGQLGRLEETAERIEQLEEQAADTAEQLEIIDGELELAKEAFTEADQEVEEASETRDAANEQVGVFEQEMDDAMSRLSELREDYYHHCV